MDGSIAALMAQLVASSMQPGGLQMGPQQGVPAQMMPGGLPNAAQMPAVPVTPPGIGQVPPGLSGNAAGVPGRAQNMQGMGPKNGGWKKPPGTPLQQ